MLTGYVKNDQQRDKCWLENVCLMIICPKNDEDDQKNNNNSKKNNTPSTRTSLFYDYQIYLQKHHHNEHFHRLDHKDSSRLPFDYHKFPRLVLLDEIDSYKKWFDLLIIENDNDNLEEDTYSNHRPLSFLRKRKFQNIPMMMANQQNNDLDEQKLISLRLCVLRCLFQELGLLLNISGDQIPSVDELKEWQQIIKQEPSRFIEMFQTFNIKLRSPSTCPQIYEWWNWLTPTTVGHAPRFDTMYYLVILNEHPGTLINGGNWYDLSEVFPNNKQTMIMPPNDLYECYCLAQFINLDHLKDYLEKEYPHLMLERWIPHIQLYWDGSISYLPGDRFYPRIRKIPIMPHTPPRMYANKTIEKMKQKSLEQASTKIPPEITPELQDLVSMNRIEHRGFECRIRVVGPFSPHYHFPVQNNVGTNSDVKSKL